MLASPCSSPSGRLLVHPGAMRTFGGGSTLGGSRHHWGRWVPLGTAGTFRGDQLLWG